MADTPQTQIAIIGGGISGLWLLNVLGNLGYSVVLLEQEALGQAQTFASQGMIHGGIKYALGGFTTPASESIASMPEVWRQCLSGAGPLPLANVNTLSEAYYLFSDGSLSSRVTAFFGSKSVRGRVTPLLPTHYPAIFANPQFSGAVYQLQDMVIDTPELLTALAQPYRNHIYRCHAKLVRSSAEKVIGVDTGHGLLTADCYILSAGAGNEALLASPGPATIEMQRRPLQQVMVKGKLPSTYAHGVSLRTAAKPRVTITTHPCSDGDQVWYLGGQLAEDGVGRSEGAQIDAARRELNALFPWIDTRAMAWATLNIDRAEPANNHQRPDTPFCQRYGNTITCWPIKLTLTPMLAEQVCAAIDITPSGRPAEALGLPSVSIGKTPWALAF
jgi:glycerol-3-phosphate dehydrogenase